VPIYLSRVQIKNFRNFSAPDLPLTPSTVIVGENKVGKTNLIYALRLALDPSLPSSADYLSHFGDQICLALPILSLSLGPNDVESGEGTRIVKKSVGRGQ
jgi:hypothetical protein